VILVNIIYISVHLIKSKTNLISNDPSKKLFSKQAALHFFQSFSHFRIKCPMMRFTDSSSAVSWPNLMSVFDQELCGKLQFTFPPKPCNWYRSCHSAWTGARRVIQSSCLLVALHVRCQITRRTSQIHVRNYLKFNSVPQPWSWDSQQSAKHWFNRSEFELLKTGLAPMLHNAYNAIQQLGLPSL